jgi:hypothetical protein
MKHALAIVAIIFASLMVYGCKSPCNNGQATSDKNMVDGMDNEALYDINIYFCEALAWVVDGHWAQHESLGTGHAIRLSPLNGHVELFNVPEGQTVKRDWIPTPEQLTAQDWQIIRGE